MNVSKISADLSAALSADASADALAIINRSNLVQKKFRRQSRLQFKKYFLLKEICVVNIFKPRNIFCGLGEFDFQMLAVIHNI